MLGSSLVAETPPTDWAGKEGVGYQTTVRTLRDLRRPTADETRVCMCMCMRGFMCNAALQEKKNTKTRPKKKKAKGHEG